MNKQANGHYVWKPYDLFNSDAPKIRETTLKERIRLLTKKPRFSVDDGPDGKSFVKFKIMDGKIYILDERRK